MRDVFVGGKEYFRGIGRIGYEGPHSDNPLAFKFYEPARMVGDKTMEEHLRYSVAYWHSSAQTERIRSAMQPWSSPGVTGTRLKSANQKAEAAFEFMSKLGTPFYAFHDADVAPKETLLLSMSIIT